MRMVKINNYRLRIHLIMGLMILHLEVFSSKCGSTSLFHGD